MSFCFQFNTLITTLEKELRAKDLSLLTATDWLILSDYITVTKSIAEGLDILQGDKHACLGFVLPTLFSIIRRLSGSMLNTAHGEKMRDVLIKSMDKRFKPTMEVEEQNKDLYLAAVTHPLFKLEWLPSDKSVIIKQWFVHIVNQKADSSLIQESDSNDFFYRYPTSHITQNAEIENYLSNPLKEVTMLKNFPTIKTLFIDYNTTLSSSAAIERMFSNATLIFQPRRNRLSSVNFERSMFLKKNKTQILNLKKTS